MSDNVHVRSQKYYDPNTLSWVAAQQPALEAGTVNLSATGLAKEAGGNLATLTAKDFATSAKQDTLHADLQTLDTDLKTNIVLKAGTNVIGHVIVDTAPTTAVTGTFWPATQPISATSLPLPSGAATNTVLTDGTLRGTVALSAGSAVVGHVIADASSAVIGHVIVDTAPTTAVTGTFWQVTQPVSGTVTANAGTNLNTSALALEAGHLATIDTSTAKIPSQGQALAANSLPVVLPATQITTLTPPAAIVGFALEAGHLAAIDTATAKIPALGQALAASSVPVVLTAAQVTTLTPPAAITGFATSANQATEIASLAFLDVALSTRTKPGDTQIIQETRPGTVAVTVPSWANISDTTRALTLLSANANRRGATVRNDSDLCILLNEGAVASLNAYTDVLKPGASYTLAYPACTVLLSGYFPRIPTGSVLVTERA